MNKNDKLINNEVVPDCVDFKINEAKILIKRENIRKRRIKNTCLSVVILSIVFLGISISNPSLAKKIPFLGNIINTLKEDKYLTEEEPFIKYINNKKDNTINEKVVSKDIGITVKEAYCDGSNIYISYLIESDNRKLEDMEHIYLGESINDGDVTASFSNEKLTIDNIASKKIDKNTYALIQSIDLVPLMSKGIDVKSNFDLDINISQVRGYGNTRGEQVVKGDWKYNINVKKDDSKNIEYAPDLENNNAVLKKILLTPNTTDVQIDIPRSFGESAYILAYDDKGYMLDEITFSYNIKSGLGTEEYKKFEPISQDSNYILIQVVDKSKQEVDVLSEFKVPLK